MGGGAWTTKNYVSYSTTKGFATLDSGIRDASYTAQDLYKAHQIDEALKPYNVMRECRDTEEHPNTVPVILALDVTGSMGSAIAEVAKRLNEVMTELYKEVQDVEFMVMGIGDLAYDNAPIQISQFESDVRIAEWLDKIFFERGGGGNSYESYTAAWYMGLYHTDLDCWKRGKKGIIITIGDETLNPYLPHKQLSALTGDNLQADVETADLMIKAEEKFDIYHLAVEDPQTSYRHYKDEIDNTFGQKLGKNNFFVVNLNNIVPRIVEIVSNNDNATLVGETAVNGNEITW